VRFRFMARVSMLSASGASMMAAGAATVAAASSPSPSWIRASPGRTAGKSVPIGGTDPLG
jgi:hypothetical protein